jgi:hypothetical protein
MRIVGKQKESERTTSGSGEALKQGALFNEEMAKVRQAFGFNSSIAKLNDTKRVFRYKTHEEADKHIQELIIDNIAEQTVNIKGK